LDKHYILHRGRDLATRLKENLKDQQWTAMAKDEIHYWIIGSGVVPWIAIQST
jgi:hypothetical protein